MDLPFPQECSNNRVQRENCLRKLLVYPFIFLLRVDSSGQEVYQHLLLATIFGFSDKHNMYNSHGIMAVIFTKDHSNPEHQN